jgi:hypothetical protein
VVKIYPLEKIMKNLILPFLVAVLLGIGACDDTTINPRDEKKDTTIIKDTTITKDTTSLKDTLNPEILLKEDIVFIDTEKDSVGVSKTYLFEINKDGSSRRKIHVVPNDTKEFSISPDKKKIVISAGEYGKQSLILLNLQTNKTTDITPQSSSLRFRLKQWLPDNKSFIYFEYFPYQSNRNVYRFDGNNHVLLNNPHTDNIDISPDGTKIIYHKKDVGIYSVNINYGSESLIYPAFYVNSLKFSPDGNQIAFQGNGNSYRLISKYGSEIGINGFSYYDNDYHAASSSIIDWSSDGKYIMFSVWYIKDNGPKLIGEYSKVVISSLTETDYSKFKIDEFGKWSVDYNQILFAKNGSIWLQDSYSGISKIITTGSLPAWVKK